MRLRFPREQGAFFFLRQHTAAGADSGTEVPLSPLFCGEIAVWHILILQNTGRGGEIAVWRIFILHNTGRGGEIAVWRIFILHNTGRGDEIAMWRILILHNAGYSEPLVAGADASKLNVFSSIVEFVLSLVVPLNFAAPSGLL